MPRNLDKICRSRIPSQDEHDEAGPWIFLYLYPFSMLEWLKSFLPGPGNRVINIVVKAFSQDQRLVENTSKLETEHEKYTRMYTVQYLESALVEN
jgi:hypothetical protein